MRNEVLEGAANVATAQTKRLSAPELTAASVIRNSVALEVSWPSIYAATAYQLQISAAKNCSKPLYSQRLRSNKVSIPQPNGRYYVQAQAIYAKDERSEYSEV